MAVGLLAAVPAGRGADPSLLESLPLVSGQHQLFLDDYALGHVYGVDRVIHQPRKFPGNPVIRSDGPADGPAIEMRDAPSWDEHEKIWKAWYMADGDANDATGFARSRDGLIWEKPDLGLVEWKGSKHNNLVEVKGHPGALLQHVFLDSSAPPDRHYKAMIGSRDRRPAVSSDGFRFTLLDVPPIPSQDESHLTWDSLRNQYILTVKHNGPFGRSVYLSLSKDFEKWSVPELIYHADALDQVLGARHIREIEADPRMWRSPRSIYPEEYNTEIYNMPIFVYEGLYIGLPTYFESSGQIPFPRGNQDGTNSVKLTCSRDLRAWTRVGDRRHFIPVSELGGNGLDTGQILAASHPIRRGNELWFYYSGLDVRYRPPGGLYHGGIDLAILRVDGFVSFRAGGDEGMVETRPVRLEGARLYVNAEAGRGRLRAEITDRTGRTILSGWSREESLAFTGDSFGQELRWKGGDGLGGLRGQVVRIRFFLKNADLYSFWLGGAG